MQLHTGSATGHRLTTIAGFGGIGIGTGDLVDGLATTAGFDLIVLDDAERST